MILMTDPGAPPGFWSFPGPPERKPARQPQSGDGNWRKHPLAPFVDALLAERDLDEADVDLFVEGSRLW